jgi:aminomethyltransferase
LTKKTPLFNKHIKANAKMVDFHGWSMPINYGSQISEHEEVRKGCGIFDVSHMAVVDFKGPDARNFIRKLIANDVDSLKEDCDGMYSSMLNEKAGVIDDLIAYKMEFGYRLVVNCARRKEDLKWIFSCSSDFDLEIVEREDLAMIAVQGPKSLEILKDLGLDALDSRKRQQGAYKDGVLAVKTGYTGEKGFEVILPNDQSEMFWEKALKAGVRPIGLAARDTLRLEAGMNLYGFEMDDSISPLECNMAWTVSWLDEERNFIGRDALLKKIEVDRYHELVGIMLDERTILRKGQKLYLDEEKELEGVVTSGTYSPTLKKPIALARLPRKNKKMCFTEARGKLIQAKIGSPKFVNEGKEVFKEKNDRPN